MDLEKSRLLLWRLQRYRMQLTLFLQRVPVLPVYSNAVFLFLKSTMDQFKSILLPQKLRSKSNKYWFTPSRQNKREDSKNMVCKTKEFNRCMNTSIHDVNWPKGYYTFWSQTFEYQDHFQGINIFKLCTSNLKSNARNWEYSLSYVK